MKNKYVIVRCDRAGVFFGKYQEKNGNELTLKDVRKLHYWDGAAAVEEISKIGTKKPNNCRFTVTIPLMTVLDPIQILPCTEEAITVIKSVKEWKA